MFKNFIHTAIAVLSLSTTIASWKKESLLPVKVLETRQDTTHLQPIDFEYPRSGLVSARIHQRGSPQIYKTNGSLDLSWNNAELFSYRFDYRFLYMRYVSLTYHPAMISGDNSVVCTTCYIKGTAYASFIISEEFDIAPAFEDFFDNFTSEVWSISSNVCNQFDSWATNLVGNITDRVAEHINDVFDGDCKPTSPKTPRDQSADRCRLEKLNMSSS